MEVLGVDIDFSAMQTAGLTDAEIALDVCRAHGQADRTGDYLRAYGRLLPERLHRRRGAVLAHVRECLAALDARDDAVNLLLTGNIRAGAVAKLRHYDLWQFFYGTGGAFSVEGSDRPSIACAARELAGAAYDPTRAFVIGDTPHDIGCGKAIGARTIAVATGPGYSLAELVACGPWLALDELPDAGELLTVLGLPD